MIMAFQCTPFSFFLFIWVTLHSLSLIQSIDNNVGITIDFIHCDSPRSPFYDPSKTRFERLRSSFERSISRKSSIQLRISNTILVPQEDIHAPLSSDGGEYLMKIAIGTPSVEFLGIADTGSDLTWIQCTPCISCYAQIEPLFESGKSKTYRALSCQSQPCSQLRGKSCDVNNVCKYRYSYGDGSYRNGDLSVETLTFDSRLSFPEVAFGCGHNNNGTFSGFGSGLIGLGGGSLSIINQLGKFSPGKFSYCLTLFGSNATSKISLGANAIVAGPTVVSTPLIRKEPATFYYLTLEGISVGNKRVDYRSGSLAREGNLIIDSGTTLTYLPSDLYEGLELALVEAVNGTRASVSQQLFKVCYEKSNNFSAPQLTVHFTGADVALAMESTFLELEEGVVCLTLVPSFTSTTIFGNLHQMNYVIGYDIEGQKLNFLQTDCSKYK